MEVVETLLEVEETLLEVDAFMEVKDLEALKQKMEPKLLFSFNQNFFYLSTKIVGRSTKIV